MTQVSYATAQALSSALISVNLMPTWEPGQVVYESATAQHLLTNDFSNGTFRTIRESSGTVSFPVIEVDSSVYPRAFSQNDVEVLIAQYPNVTYTNGAFQEETWTWEIICDGNSYFGENSDKLEAMADAFTNLLSQV